MAPGGVFRQKLAEIAGQYLRREGLCRGSNPDPQSGGDRDGQDRYATEIRADIR